jgi:predicted DNA-binding protein
VQDAEQKKGKKMQHESKKYRQFPVRLELSVSDQLDRYAKLTRIPKTTIARFAIEKFVNEIEISGLAGAVEEVFAASRSDTIQA